MFTAPNAPPLPAPRKTKTHAEGGVEIRCSLLVHGPQKDDKGEPIANPATHRPFIVAKHVQIHIIDAEEVARAAQSSGNRGLFDLRALVEHAAEECNDADRIEITPENVGKFIAALDGQS